MITLQKIELYEKYNGFVDAYIFENRNLANNLFEPTDWSSIDELIGDMILLKKGNISSDFRARLEHSIQQKTENNSVIKHLEKLAQIRIDAIK